MCNVLLNKIINLRGDTALAKCKIIVALQKMTWLPTLGIANNYNV